MPNGFSPEQCSDERRRALRPEMRERLGVEAGEIALLLIANEWHRKGLGVLLRAMALVGDPRVRLLLVGKQAPTAYDGLILELGLQGIRFLLRLGDLRRLSARDTCAREGEYRHDEENCYKALTDSA